MKKIVSLCISIFLSLCVYMPSVMAQDTDRPWVYTDMTNQFEVSDSASNIRGGDMILYSKISAISTTQSSYDVYAPFDGRIEEVHAELFDTVDKDTVLATEFTTELAAMMDSTPESGKKQTRRRWQDTFQQYFIKPEEKGIITRIHVSPNTKVVAGDRLFTVSRKVLLIGRNTEPIYNPLFEGMTAEVEHHRTGDTFSAKLVRFIPIKDKPYYYRLWLEVTDIKKGMAIGEQYDGNLTVAKSIGTRIIDRTDLIRHNGKKYVIIEVETGLETEKEIELIRPITKILNWRYIKDGVGLDEKSKKETPKAETAAAKADTSKTAQPATVAPAKAKAPVAKKNVVQKRKGVAGKAVVKPGTGRKAGVAAGAGKKGGTAARRGAAAKKTAGKAADKPADKTISVPSAPAKKTDGEPIIDNSGDDGKTDATPAPAPEANPEDAKPMDVKVEGESDSKVYSSNDDVSSDFLEGED